MVSELPPSSVVSLIRHAAKKEAEELMRPMWYVNMIAHAVNPKIELMPVPNITKTESKPQRSADEIAAELLPLADRR